MNKLFATRNSQIFAVFIFLMLVLIGRMFSLTVVQGQEWEKASASRSMKSIYTMAPRGEIKDRYGRILATNKPRFVVQLIVDAMDQEQINPTVEKLIGVLKQNGDTYIDEFPIQVVNGKFIYTHDEEVKKWLASQEMPTNFTAAQAFEEIRRRQSISEDLDKYEAQEELQTLYDIFPPISVRNMEFTEAIEKRSFLQKYEPKDSDKAKSGYVFEEESKDAANYFYNMTAEEAFYLIADSFKVDKTLSVDKIREIIVIRDAVKSKGYLKYLPVRVAYDISQSTIATIQEQSDDFMGVEVLAEPVRYYPYGHSASHILGYIGQMTEEEKKVATENGGQSSSTMIGKEGIEKAFETTLRGTDGIKKLEVNAQGSMERVIDNVEAQKGRDVYVTVDIELQKIAEQALEEGLRQIRRGGTFNSNWGNYTYPKAYSKANAGAIVVLDVKTSEVLAMASYPDFDPNVFAQGITKEQWAAYQTQNPRDPLSPVPLYNIAARTAVQPGSIFKMVIATMAVDKGLNPEAELYDDGAIAFGNKTFGCSIWNSSHGTLKHGNINLVHALEVSCNYYFYDAGTGIDWYKKKKNNGKDVPITKEPVTIATIMDYAKMFGLGLPTGIEIPEAEMKVPSEAQKLATTKSNLKNLLTKRAKRYFKEEVTLDAKKQESVIAEIISWADYEEPISRSEVRKRLIEIGVKDEMLERVTDTCKYGYFNQAKWTIADQLNISIGQGENAYTPLQMANYIATIANGGTLNKVSLIKGIQGQHDLAKEPGTKINLTNPEIFQYLGEGMRLVAAGQSGTARGSFANFKVKVAAKTGSAQRGGKINPPDEVEYIKQHLRQFDPKLSFAQVEAEMARLMTEEPENYKTRNSAVRAAVEELSDRITSTTQLDVYKENYDAFGWFVCFAPYEEPEIAISILLFQGGAGGSAAPIAKEVIAKYMGLDEQYIEFEMDNEITQ